MKSRTEILVPLAAIQAVPIAVIAWYRLHRYAWYRYSAIVKKLIEGFNHGYLHSNFDGLCSILLEKYTDEVWNDFEAAFTDDKYLGFILQVKNEIGSGA